jgi:lipopolysaccharide/colanic/teichoic acid biosynthesis glycosyltransferase
MVGEIMGSEQIKIKEIVEQSTLPYTVSGTYLIIKRLFDMVFALLAMILLLPVFFITVMAIFLESPGPIIFSQTRYGLKGKQFKMFKFRSRAKKSEDLIGGFGGRNEAYDCTHKMKHDPYMTRVGWIIRRTRIDGLPQLVNVLKGDMSLVGPCPSEPREFRMYAAWHKLRMSVRPGMTGLWQISDRDENTFEKMISLDLKYIRERSFKYDIGILFKTLFLL